MLFWVSGDPEPAETTQSRMEAYGFLIFIKLDLNSQLLCLRASG